MADGPDFSPLSREEIAAAPAIAKPVRNDCEIVALVPLDAATLGVKFKGRKPDEIFWFRGERGERLFAECRWNLEDGAKEVRPACFTVKDGSSSLIERRARSTTSTNSPLGQVARYGCSKGPARQTGPRSVFRAQ